MNHAVVRRYVANNSQEEVWCAAAHALLLINHLGKWNKRNAASK